MQIGDFRYERRTGAPSIMLRSDNGSAGGEHSSKSPTCSPLRMPDWNLARGFRALPMVLHYRYRRGVAAKFAPLIFFLKSRDL
jgi:hypothetical protein